MTQTAATLTEQGLYDHLSTEQIKALADRLFNDATATLSWSVSQGFSTEMADAKFREYVAVETLYWSRA